MSVVLYSTLGCHLCELAEELLQQSSLAQWQVIEIAESESLVERYGVRIPVVALEDASGEELGWPFDLAQLESWLANPKISDC